MYSQFATEWILPACLGWTVADLVHFFLDVFLDVKDRNVRLVVSILAVLLLDSVLTVKG